MSSMTRLAGRVLPEAGADLLARAQRAGGQALRTRVAGANARQAAERIWARPGPRRFAEDDPIWRVHADAAMFPGGLAALLLQSLHPQAMAGVAGHSGYRGDPWGRLQRTSHFIAVTTYGTTDDADAAIDRVRGIHRRVRGRDDRGTPYRADDPNLLRWVHVAEASCFLGAHQRFGVRPLTPAEADAYVAQSAVIAARLGATGLPQTVAELAAALVAFRPALRSTPAARDTARFLLLNPPVPLPARPGYGAVAAGAFAILPGWARRELRLPAPRVLDPLHRALGIGATRTIRWAMAGLENRPAS